MRSEVMVVTNNPSVDLQEQDLFIQGTLLDVFKYCRDLVHQGNTLISHPLVGSVKPNESPYKSVIVSRLSQKQLDFKSLSIIEASLQTAERMLREKPLGECSEQILSDFQYIDKDLLNSGLAAVANPL